MADPSSFGGTILAMVTRSSLQVAESKGLPGDELLAAWIRAVDRLVADGRVPIAVVTIIHSGARAPDEASKTARYPFSQKVFADIPETIRWTSSSLPARGVGRGGIATTISAVEKCVRMSIISLP